MAPIGREKPGQRLVGEIPRVFRFLKGEFHGTVCLKSPALDEGRPRRCRVCRRDGDVLALGSVASLALVDPRDRADGTPVGSIDVGVSPDGTGIVGGFTSTLRRPEPRRTPPPRNAASTISTGSRWSSPTTIRPTCPTAKPVPPYIDPPIGGYTDQWADGLPWYWDEGEPPEPGTPDWEPGYHLDDNLTDTNGDGVERHAPFCGLPLRPAAHQRHVQDLVGQLQRRRFAPFLPRWLHLGISQPAAGAEGEGLGEANRNIFPTGFGGMACRSMHPLDPAMAYRWYHCWSARSRPGRRKP